MEQLAQSVWVAIFCLILLIRAAYVSCATTNRLSAFNLSKCTVSRRQWVWMIAGYWRTHASLDDGLYRDDNQSYCLEAWKPLARGVSRHFLESLTSRQFHSLPQTTHVSSGSWRPTSCLVLVSASNYVPWIALATGWWNVRDHTIKSVVYRPTCTLLTEVVISMYAFSKCVSSVNRFSYCNFILKKLPIAFVFFMPCIAS